MRPRYRDGAPDGRVEGGSGDLSRIDAAVRLTA